jgi:hypothetical protein
VEQVAEVESGSAIVRFQAAAQAPEVAVHSPAAVPAGVQPEPAAPGELPAWAEEEVLAAVEGADSFEDSFNDKAKEQGHGITAIEYHPTHDLPHTLGGCNVMFFNR